MKINSVSNIDNLNNIELIDILSWYIENGVNEFVSKKNINHLNNDQIKSSLTKPTKLDKIHTTNYIKQNNYNYLIQKSKKTAINCNSLKELKYKLINILINIKEYHLKYTTKKFIFGQGFKNSNIMIISQSPKKEEEETGTAFTGVNGIILDQILKSIGLDRNNVWLNYLLPCYLLGNITPNINNINICLPFLLRQIELINPKIIIIFDNLVYKSLTKQQINLFNSHGEYTVITINNKKYKIIPTFHPQVLINNPIYKQMVWQDFLNVKKNI